MLRLGSTQKTEAHRPFVRKPFIMGAAAFFLTLVPLRIALWEPARCADGWASPSIGRSGACSHHGGVGHGNPLPFLMSVLAGVTTGWLVSRGNRIPVRKPDEVEDEGPAPNYPPLPQHLLPVAQKYPDEMAKLRAELPELMRARRERARSS